MARVYADRVLEYSTSTGTGNFTLTGLIPGFQRFATVCAPADTFDYAIFAVDSNGLPTGDWETGRGTYSAANTLTRTTTQGSSNGNATVSFSAGLKYVILSQNALSIAAGGGGGGGRTLISSVATVSGDTSAAFTSIPNTYDSLLLRARGRTTVSSDNDEIRCRFNADTGSNYGWSRVGSAGGSAFSSGEEGVSSTNIGYFTGNTSPSGFLGTLETDLVKYADTVFRKLFTSRFAGVGPPTIYQGVMGNRWDSAEAISRIDLFAASGGAFVVGSTFDLYGL